MTWAQRLKRVFNIDITTCQACDGTLKVIACIEDPHVIRKILDHLDRLAPTTDPNSLPEPRAPPPAGPVRHALTVPLFPALMTFPDPAEFRSSGTRKMTHTPRSTTTTFAKYSPHPASFAPPAQTNQYQSALGRLVLHRNVALCFYMRSTPCSVTALEAANLAVRSRAPAALPRK